MLFRPIPTWLIYWLYTWESRRDLNILPLKATVNHLPVRLAQFSLQMFSYISTRSFAFFPLYLCGYTVPFKQHWINQLNTPIIDQISRNSFHIWRFIIKSNWKHCLPSKLSSDEPNHYLDEWPLRNNWCCMQPEACFSDKPKHSKF